MQKVFVFVRNIKLVIWLVVFLLSSVLIKAQGVQGEESKYVFILSSYSYDQEWSTALAKSIREKIEDENLNTIVNIAYAGVMENNSFLAGRFGMQAAFANARISQTRICPDIMVLIGEESWMYYRIMNLRGSWANVPVVMIGVHPYIMEDYSLFFSLSDDSIDKKMIPLKGSSPTLSTTAIIEAENEANTLSLMKSLIPDLQQIVFLSDDNYQDEYSRRLLKNILAKDYPSISLNILESRKSNPDSVKQVLQTLPPTSAVLVNMHQVPDESAVPVFTLRDNAPKGGIVVGGYYPSISAYVNQATDIISRIFDGYSANSIPFSTIRGATLYLNKEAINNFKLSRNVSEIRNVTYVNIPPPFYVKYMRVLLVSLLLFVIVITIILLVIREQIHRKELQQSSESYGRLYDEFEYLYENMPMGLIQLDADGYIISSNPGSEHFLRSISLRKEGAFNLFSTQIIDENIKRRINRKNAVSSIVELDERFYRIILRYVWDEENEQENILMIVMDNTEVYKEREAKERIHSIFNFAMNASALGVAEYNLVDKVGFATNAWYENLRIEKDNNFTHVYKKIVKEDREKIENFLSNIGENNRLFTDLVRVQGNDGIHWLEYVIQLMDYSPEKGKIVIAELNLNMDAQKQREEELAKALVEAKESDRMKNAFVANMTADINISLRELVKLSTTMTSTRDMEEKMELLADIEHNNDILLRYVKKIIQMSQSDQSNSTDL